MERVLALLLASVRLGTHATCCMTVRCRLDAMGASNLCVGEPACSHHWQHTGGAITFRLPAHFASPPRGRSCAKLIRPACMPAPQMALHRHLDRLFEGRVRLPAKWKPMAVQQPHGELQQGLSDALAAEHAGSR